MAVWDKASWQGPPDSNYSGAMSEFRGLIWHIAEGSYWGTIGWQQNSISDVSSHFVIGLNEGEIAQMLDTTVTAWTQAAGNGHWVSVEYAGFATGQLTAAQFEAGAQLYAWLVQVHGIPVQLAETPSGRGLGWHGMGGAAWGSHPNCPGPANVALRPSNLVRVAQILGGDPIQEDDDMLAHRVRSGANDGSIYLAPGYQTPSGKIAAFALDGPNDAAYGGFPLVQLPAGVTVGASGKYDINAPVAWPAGGSSGGGATQAQVAAAVRAELDKTELPSVPGKLGV